MPAENIIALIILAFIVTITFIIPVVKHLSETGEDKRSIRDESMQQFTQENRSEKISDSYNNYIDIKIGNLIIHPTAIRELGEAGAKILEAGNVFYDRDRGVLVLEGKTREEIYNPRIKQLMSTLNREDD